MQIGAGCPSPVSTEVSLLISSPWGNIPGLGDYREACYIYMHLQRTEKEILRREQVFSLLNRENSAYFVFVLTPVNVDIVQLTCLCTYFFSLFDSGSK